MEKQDLITVAEIMLTADNDCSYCAYDLMILLGRAYPQYRDDIIAVYESQFPAGEWCWDDECL